MEIPFENDALTTTLDHTSPHHVELGLPEDVTFDETPAGAGSVWLYIRSLSTGYTATPAEAGYSTELFSRAIYLSRPELPTGRVVNQDTTRVIDRGVLREVEPPTFPPQAEVAMDAAPRRFTPQDLAEATMRLAEALPVR